MDKLRGNSGFLHLGLLFVVIIVLALVWVMARLWHTSPLVHQITTLVEEGRKTAAAIKDNPKEHLSMPRYGKSTTIRPEEYYKDANMAPRKVQEGR
jgi:hypothetical protein